MKIGNNNRRTINKIAVPIIAVNIPAALKNRNDSINTIESIVGMSLKANLIRLFMFLQRRGNMKQHDPVRSWNR